MKKITFISLLCIFSCREDKKIPIPQIHPPQVDNISINSSNESELAEKWLVGNIENYFKTDLGSMDKTMQSMTTKDYYEYKTDAANVDMEVDGSLTLKQFQDKWRKKFDVQKAGIGVGFLITGQDWDEIKVSTCDLIAESDNTFLFDMILTDKKYAVKYPIRVSVIKNQDSFLIEDVLQEIPESN